MKRFSLVLCMCLAACGGSSSSSSSGGSTDGFDITACDNLDEFAAPADVNSWAYWLTDPVVDRKSVV